MALYVDGYLLPLPKNKVNEYRRMATLASKVWKEHGALEYRECVGDDLASKKLVSFTKSARAKPGETVVFAWIVYKSRADRDRVNKAVMEDERLQPMMEVMKDPKRRPFDVKRMAMGGFKVLVDA